MDDKRVIDLYLELIKRVLTNTLFEREPDANQDNDFRFVAEFINHYINGPAVSMMPIARFDNLRACIEDVIARDVPGALIETGVWRGGGVIFMRAVLRAHGVTDRTVWVADSFEGLPAPDADKYPIEAKAHAGKVMRDTYK
ncbi:MAG: TylF/MycF/NovP-related O-methyltransferase, partial [Steroidobacteraceae bacterium]